MEVTDIFDSLAGYLNFIIELLSFAGMERFARLGSISPELVSYFVIGVGVAYMISRVRTVPTLAAPPVQAGGSSVDAASEESEINMLAIGKFVLLSIAGALLFHFSFSFYNWILGEQATYSVQDTLNAVFAYNAFYFPFDAASRLGTRILTSLATVNRRSRVLSGMLILLVSLVGIGSTVYLLYAMATVHSMFWGSVFWFSVVFVIVCFVTLFGFFKMLGLSLKEMGLALAASN